MKDKINSNRALAKAGLLLAIGAFIAGCTSNLSLTEHGLVIVLYVIGALLWTLVD